MTYGDSLKTVVNSFYGRSADYKNTITSAPESNIGTNANVGTYTVAWHGGAGTTWGERNLRFAYSQSITITPRTLTVAANDVSRDYGDENPTLTYKIVEGSLAFEDQLAGSLTTTATAMSSVVFMRSGKARSRHHLITKFTFVPDGGKLTVNKRSIEITADSLQRAYGDSNPDLTYQFGSKKLVGSDKLTGQLTTAATQTSNVGSYDILGILSRRRPTMICISRKAS